MSRTLAPPPDADAVAGADSVAVADGVAVLAKYRAEAASTSAVKVRDFAVAAKCSAVVVN